jgi:hypothetical protein
VTGEISLTCDAWQADNTNGYFAVTGHWIKECVPGEWTLEHTLLGFAQMNCSHSRAHLGQMLYKILNCLQIVHKVRILAVCSRSLAHSLIKHRLVILHVTTRRTTPRCFKNLQSATNSRQVKASILNISTSGMQADFYWHRSPTY